MNSVPAATPVAIPGLPTSLLIVTTALLLDRHKTEASDFMDPSRNVPVATNLWLDPTPMDAFEGVTEIEVKPDGTKTLG